ncbi:MAG TPA: hypothetical protein VJ654_01805 [Noviherbaspirillum sp.]|nr:hypothetical protein [Noviherbaspirillum sp.]
MSWIAVLSGLGQLAGFPRENEAQSYARRSARTSPSPVRKSYCFVVKDFRGARIGKNSYVKAKGKT